MSDAEGSDIWFINRTLVILKPGEPFARWVQDLERAERDRPTLKEALAQPTAFLIPEFEFEGEAQEWLSENCDSLFELQLPEWYVDEALWPKDRTWKVFKDWFEIEIIDVAWDMVDAPLSSARPAIEN